MNLAGFQKLSMVDYPAHLASVVFLQGCNFRCPYCYNLELIEPNQRFSCQEEDLFEFLSNQKTMIEGVVVTGGEPFLQKGLADFIKRIKEKGFKVKVDTNGSNPQELRALLDKDLLDYVAIDVKTSFPKYHLLGADKSTEKKVRESVSLIMRQKTLYEFRTTCVPGIVDEQDFFIIGEAVRGAPKHCLQQFRPQETYDANFQKVKPYTKEDIQKFKRILENFVKTVEVRGL